MKTRKNGGVIETIFSGFRKFGGGHPARPGAISTLIVDDVSLGVGPWGCLGLKKGVLPSFSIFLRPYDLHVINTSPVPGALLSSCVSRLSVDGFEHVLLPTKNYEVISFGFVVVELRIFCRCCCGTR